MNTDTGLIQDDARHLKHFAKSINSRLRDNKVSNRKRALLVASILIALTRRSFNKDYKATTDSKALARLIATSVANQLQETSQHGSSFKKLSQRFCVAEHETYLLANHGELYDIVRSVHNKLIDLHNNRRHDDLLGELYIEFLRYAESDKDLGIVLTPPHVAELFAEIAQVDAMSRVYDNCAGTGGFLIAAMNRMIRVPITDKETSALQQNHLFGVELQSDVYPLLIANMYIYQNHTANIMEGNCFNPKIHESIAQLKPTVGLLNPPYRKDKTTDRHEQEFVYQNLNSLQAGGVCVALLPMQCALDSKGKALEIKRTIMERHSLEAVLSMPDELFFNSKVSVVSCAMVFRAWQPHEKADKVYLGYYKDDGLVKTKTAGRTDANGVWHTKRNVWVDALLYRREQAGFSTNVELDYKSEWAVEDYLETDYTSITDDLFVKSLLDYSTYLFANKLLHSATSASEHKTKHTLPEEQDWEYCRLPDYFEIEGTETTVVDGTGIDDYASSGYPYVTTKSINNGVAGFCNKSTETGGVLTVDSAVKGYCAYQKQEFVASDHVEKLVPKFEMDDYLAMFLVTIINMEQYRYSYGRKASQSRLRKSRIKLPSKHGKPDWDLMRCYIKSLPYSANLDVGGF